LNLPLRGPAHPALVAYVIRASTTLFGRSRFASRALHLAAGLAAILVAAAITRHWYGARAARWTAALLAFNEYHIRISSIATSHAPQLFFVALATYACHRLLATQRPGWFYAASAATALAFYCKEHSALVLVVCLLVLLRREHRRWFRTPHPYLAGLLFLLLLAPDVYWNLAAEHGGQATYAAHLTRVGGIGLSPYPLAFYGRSVVGPIAGAAFIDNTTENDAKSGWT
jgi:dolichol-phosphate mannosyltransferase